MTEPTVLIVEDEVLLALEAESLLAEAGFRPVGHAVDSEEARILATKLRPDVALVDVHLLDGPTGVEVARFLAREAGALVVFATGNARRLPSDLAGAVDVIEKPYSDRGFKAAMIRLRHMLNGGAASDEGARPQLS